ncbi:MAG: large conductance mechanosensitive channel protein MscL [Acidobacteria bacterium]|nr:large conductance mechanosensitive channel protein MscL [Acidobacteriota bacterium]
MLKEFKEFIVRGNVIDLAIAVILGGAFGPIVNSAVSDIIMPPIGMMMGNVDFKDLFFSLSGTAFPTLAAAKAAGAPVIAYGSFINTVINFLIISFAIFMMVKQVNRFNAPAPAPAAPATKDCPQCLNAIPVNAKRCGHCTTQL